MSRRLLWPLPLLLTAACGDPTAPAQVATALAVTGRITDAGGLPLPGATLTFEVRRGEGLACEAGAPLTVATAATDAQGRVAFALRSAPGPAFTACVDVAVAPPTGRALRPVFIAAVGRRFVPLDAGAALDTLRVDAGLLPAPGVGARGT